MSPLSVINSFGAAPAASVCPVPTDDFESYTVAGGWPQGSWATSADNGGTTADIESAGGPFTSKNLSLIGGGGLHLYRTVYTPVSFQDGVVAAKVAWSGGAGNFQPSLIARVVDASNYLTMRFSIITGQFTMYETIGGSDNQRSSGAGFSWTAETIQWWRLTVSGTSYTMEAYEDDCTTLIQSDTFNDLTTTNTGNPGIYRISNFSTNTFRIDDFYAV